MITADALEWRGHPVWLVGFRPFFLLAAVFGAVLPPVWVLMITGAIAPPTSVPVMQWHAHEMFFGFGMAVLGGFLLTASKNWVKVRGHHGRALQLLVFAWLLERAALWWGGAWPPLLFLLASHLFLGALVALLLWTLIRHRAADSYRDNVIFIVVLPLFIVAKALLLDPAHFAEGREVTLGLFRVAFFVMIERTLVPFMRGAFGLELPRAFAVDVAIKGLGLALLVGPWLPPVVKTVLALALVTLVLGRFAFWSPHRALTRLDTAVMYLGGGALAAQVALDGLSVVGVGTPTVHVFTFGTMGLIIPAMFTRITKGHTGRPPTFDGFDRAALWVMLGGFLARVIAPQLWPAHYSAWVWLAAGCWSACFALVAVRITPLVLHPRVDGKEH